MEGGLTMIKTILESLHEEQRDQLMYAFEQGFTQIIIYAPGQFIGVNVQHVGNLDLQNQEGVWAIGRIKNGNL